MPQPTQRAREALASALLRESPANLNTANSVRAGYTNYWVLPALNAIEAAFRDGPEDDDAQD